MISNSQNNYSLPVAQTADGLKIYKLDPKYHDITSRQPQISEEQREHILFGRDRRQHIKNTHAYPYRTMGALISQYNVPPYGQSYIGTATLVGPDIILTCAHNVYHKDEKTNIGYKAKKVTFFLGMNGGYYVGEYQCVPPYFYHLKYQSASNLIEDRQYDWAFIKLSRRVTDTQPMPLIIDYPQIDKLISIYGYPGEKAMYPNQYFMYGMQERYRLDQYNKNKIMYWADTTGGQSGSAVIVKEQNGMMGIIGVHTTGTSLYNHGVRIDSDKFRLARYWCEITHGVGSFPVKVYQKEQKKTQIRPR